MSDSQEIETTPETAPVAPSEGTQPSDPVPSNPPAEVPAGSEPTIPYSRFREVNEQKKMLQQQIEQMRYQQPSQPSYMQPQAEQAPKQEAYANYEEFLNANAAFTARHAARMEFQALQSQQNESQNRMQQQNRASNAYQNWSSKTADIAAKDPMFQSRALEILGNLPAELGLMVMNDPATKELTTHFASHPEDAFRLTGLNPYQAAREIGALSAKLANAPAKMVSKMPTPMAPVGSGKTGSKPADDLSVQDITSRLYPRK